MKKSTQAKKPSYYFEYKRNRTFLSEYRKWIDQYFDMCEKHGYQGNIGGGNSAPSVELMNKESDDYKLYTEARRQINLGKAQARECLRRAGVQTTMYYSPPPITGGLAGEIDLLANVFNHHGFYERRSTFTDLIEKAEGYYNYWIKYWEWRIWNPLMYLQLAIVKFFSIPIEAYEYMTKRSNTDSVFPKLLAIIGSTIIFILLNGAIIVSSYLAIKGLFFNK